LLRSLGKLSVLCSFFFYCLPFSEITPTTATLLAELCHEVGLPSGVFNIVHGTGPRTGQAILEHKAISAISFTGGTLTGGIVASVAGRTFKKLSLELGGKNPNVIFAGK
jgi:aminomuconate-semialdehyde/2-hydroxymuconate-6-semialdehyde dehydrogenase